MSLVVDRYALGPLQTNCYVVRAPSAARRRRSSSTRAATRPSCGSSSRGSGATCAAILITHGHFDHLGGVADLAEGTGAPVYMPEGERDRLEQLRRVRAGRHARAGRTRPTTCSTAARRSTVAGHRVRVRRDSRATRPRTSRSTPTARLFSGDLLFAGSVGRVDLPGADWDTLLDSVRTLADRYPPETVVYPGHGPRDDARRRARAQPVPRGAARVTRIRGAARHARRPPVRRSRSGRR